MKKYIFLLLLCVISIPLFAVTGGVQISATTTDCNSANKEADVLDHAANARLWISVPSGDQAGDLTFTILDEGKIIVNPTNVRTTSCGDGFFFGDIQMPDHKGAVTVVVEHQDGKKAGSDTVVLQ